MSRAAVTLIALIAFTPVARAQVTLGEAPAAGECFRYSVELDLTGKLIVTQEGTKEPIRLDAKARHLFAERTLTTADGMPARSARYYDSAAASAVVSGDKADRALPTDRALIVAHRNSDGTFCFSPTGPLTRDELDLVTEHFNPQCIPGLLPNKAVNVGDSWTVAPAAVQAACLFDGLIKNGLTGKLTAAANGQATFTIEGTAEGIENGAKVTLTITATGTFDATAKRVTALTWKQKDDREQGPVAPASQVEVTVALKRAALAEVPKELTDAALAAVPKGDVPAALALLRHADPKKRYELVYPRDWHVTGQTEQHLILRLLDKGEFIAQATFMVWKKADPGKHTPADEFKKAVGSTAGWVASRVIEDAETSSPDGRWMYRITAEGKMEELPVVQSFNLVAGPQGDQVAVTFAMKPDKAKAVGARDRELVNALAFPKK
ncbi:hypothetical protein J8F10_30715 [Gemmata sp. G18]|uniref:DUF4412 domain-containing protein n=1 Tax=Gemmata palustris TaxID=2822762 RepID=A0ABS5C195_9BACT|nr:hypothetical protein [Gemmata palustris]MBP3959640.1 hypothetical protein [Gemmata palustris]